jgi:hypothetical protein
VTGVNQEEEAGVACGLCILCVCVDVTLILLMVGHEWELLMLQLLSPC